MDRGPCSLAIRNRCEPTLRQVRVDAAGARPSETTKRVVAILLVIAACASPAIARLIFYAIDDPLSGVAGLAFVAIPVGAIVLWVIVRVISNYPADPPPTDPDRRQR